MTSVVKRGGILAALVLLVAACSGGFSGATEAPASQAPATSGTASEAPASASAAAGEPVTLTVLEFDGEASQLRVQAYIDAYTALHPEVTIEVESRPGGADGDNIVKTRLATGDMPDIFGYNSGSLLQALNPADTLVDLSGDPAIENIVDAYFSSVSQGDQIFGVPAETAMGGGILYNKTIYDELGLQVPKTWEEFAANNQAIKDAGEAAPVCATYGDTWTSQLFVLADYYNVQTAVPDFAEKYTMNQAHYSDTPAAMAGFGYLQEGFEKDWWQDDFATDKFDVGQQKVAQGECAHYPMLTFVLGSMAENFPDEIQNVGFFAQPGPDAATNGATIWMPAAYYIPKTSKNIEAAKDFLAFVASVAGTEAATAGVAPAGPYMVKGASLPADALPAVKDIQAYIDADAAGPALEFLSPVKGPALEQLTVGVGTGQYTAEEAAALYDEDVKKQAQQLGLPGWE
jgi:raffinose/stachyose/melibiose transport system substrate-binding protein